jgi:DNA-binding PadR family transcriptional regulator
MTGSDFDELLATWEGNYKKGLLTFWLLLILHEREAYAFEMSTLITKLSGETIIADDNSIYRALNRFEEIGIVSSTWRESDIGPRRRYYQITVLGLQLLQAFISRNILRFNEKEIARRIQAVMADSNQEEG